MKKLYLAHTLTAHRYAETFEAFLSRSTEYSAMVDQLIVCGKQLAAENTNGFSCLDVGAGTGQLIRSWVMAAAQKNEESNKKQQQQQEAADKPEEEAAAVLRTAPSRYVGIEPNPDHAKSLQDVLDNELCIKGTVLRMPFSPTVVLEEQEGLFGDEDKRTKHELLLFDVVLFSHSLYFMPNAEPCVRHAMEYLKPNGMALIFIQGPFGFYTMHHLFEPLLDRGGGGAETTTSVFAYHGISSHEVVQDLRSAGYNPVVTSDRTVVDLTNIFDDATKVHERDEIISFILQVEFASLGEPLKTDILQTLEASCVLDAQGNLCLHHPNMSITVRR